LDFGWVWPSHLRAAAARKQSVSVGTQPATDWPTSTSPALTFNQEFALARRIRIGARFLANMQLSLFHFIWRLFGPKEISWAKSREKNEKQKMFQGEIRTAILAIAHKIAQSAHEAGKKYLADTDTTASVRSEPVSQHLRYRYDRAAEINKNVLTKRGGEEKRRGEGERDQKRRSRRRHRNSNSNGSSSSVLLFPASVSVALPEFALSLPSPHTTHTHTHTHTDIDCHACAHVEMYLYINENERPDTKRNKIPTDKQD